MIRILLLVTLVPFLGAITPAAGQINWLTWEEAQEVNQQEPRKIMVDVYTQWCGWCKKMDSETFAEKDICDYINAHYYAVKFDAGTKEDIDLNGRVYKFIKTTRGGYHELASEIMFGKMSYPTIVFMDENFNILQPIPGYKDPGSLDKIMKYFAEDFYKTTPWKKYEEMYNQQTPNPVPAKGDGD
jgi:thioredoxin-related protein